MRREEIPSDIETLAFSFFYWFSRFEFVLKENGFLKNKKFGSTAEPDWDDFVKTFESKYELTKAGAALIEARPQRQVVVGNTRLDFRDVIFDDNTSDLGKVVRMAKTVRNNLFHGGKHGADNWDNPDRVRELLRLVVSVLDEFAKLTGFVDDHRRRY